ncbi:suppressor of RPS4-RLD 1 [Impatiens glandulifera]|uniref:suppressor of RPS4-RLD 1 n=1 Tax=Impatiens glandulifera TaxID=253017 RepID=UPI001FB105E8|nr:suppressor of RPS4-RLD 1 [Impatiens glandulifera]
MASAISERVELAKFCSSRDWSKAIRVLDYLLTHSCHIQDICNRAFCYSQLDLHKHVIKDCDKALHLDPTLLQAYILKGRAFSSLGKKEDALLVWEQGYDYALRQSTDLKQLLELEELLKDGRQHLSHDENTTEADKSVHTIQVDNVVPCELMDAPVDNNKLLGTTFGQDLNGISEIHKKQNGEWKMDYKSGSNVQKDKILDTRTNGNYDSQPTGIGNLHVKLNDNSGLHNVSDDSYSKSIDPGTYSKSNDRSEMFYGLLDEVKNDTKFPVTRIAKTKTFNVDLRLSRGIEQVNEGRYVHAISIFDQILEEYPTYPEALIGRGTAYAFTRELDAAIADFTRAVKSNPSAGEAWKRRGQARAALGEYELAIADLTNALQFEPNLADVLHERGIVNFKFKDFDAAVKDLSACIKLDKDNKSAYTYLGLALSSTGEYLRAEEAHKKSIQLDKKFLEAWGHLTQFYQELANPGKALECLLHVLEINNSYAKAYYVRGLLLHGMGDHRNAIKDLTAGLSLESSNIECLYLRASCHHAIGEFKEAVKDYDNTLDLELDSMDKFVLQCLAFYQKEIALYTASRINSGLSWFDIDRDIDPLFKEYWCKRLHPKNVCEKVYRQPPLRDSLKKVKLRKQDFNMTKQKSTLLEAADSIGKRIQYSCPGFLPNRRQHRMAGLAAIEIAQKVTKAWRSLQTEWRHSNKSTSKQGKKTRRKDKMNMPNHNRGGACCSTNSPPEASTSYGGMEERSTIWTMMSWHDIYSVAVKWRQISEPCDPVVWVNKLSIKEFKAGFGSHTPLILGQEKVVRYFPNFQKTLKAAKEVIKTSKYAHSKSDKKIDLSEDGKLHDIMAAESCNDIYRIIGEDFWLATWCKSTAFEGKYLEGTRITLLKMEHGFNFAIRTPCVPSRWDDFDAEMAAAWDAVSNAYCGEVYGSSDLSVLEYVKDAILRMTYYWYNFMPLSRGSAVVGFTVLLGLFLAANMEFNGSIPEGVQVDWEAILNFEPNTFVDSVKTWLYPNLKHTNSLKDYPDVASTFETTGSVIAALSSHYN